MKTEDLVRYIELGSLPVVVYCEKKYEGICLMLKVIKNNTVFLDYDTVYDDAESEGAFRASFQYDSFESMIAAIERFTGKALDELVLNPYCYELFACTKPAIKDFQWDLYNGNIRLLDGYSKFQIGSFWWRGLYEKKIRPDASAEEIAALLNDV